MRPSLEVRLTGQALIKAILHSRRERCEAGIARWL
jgi:hypothetical protein